MSTIKIRQPIAIPGDKVMAHNYRKKGNQWEEGECRDAEYKVRRDGTGWWHYTVLLDRRTPSNISYGREWGNNVLILYVSDDGIEKL